MIFINIKANPTRVKSEKETEVHIFHSMLPSEEDVFDEASSTKATSKMMFQLERFSSKQHCLKSVQIRSFFWSVFSRIRTEYGEMFCISPYSVRMRSLHIQSECGKIRTRKNSVFGHISHSVNLLESVDFSAFFIAQLWWLLLYCYV